MTLLDECVLGDSKTVVVGDMVKVFGSHARYEVQRIERDEDGNVELAVYGGKLGHLSSRVFTPDVLVRCRDQKDRNDAWRAAVREVGAQTMKRKGKR